MILGKVTAEMKAWEGIRDRRYERAILAVMNRVLNNADIALRQRNQKTMQVTIATDFEERLAGKYWSLAQTLYAQTASELRHLNCKVQKGQDVIQVSQMKLVRIRVIVDLAGADLKVIQEKLRYIRRQLKKK